MHARVSSIVLSKWTGISATIIAIAVAQDVAATKSQPANLPALEHIATTEPRSNRALQLAYDVIEHLEKDGLVYRKKVMVICVC